MHVPALETLCCSRNAYIFRSIESVADRVYIRPISDSEILMDPCAFHGTQFFSSPSAELSWITKYILRTPQGFPGPWLRKIDIVDPRHTS